MKKRYRWNVKLGERSVVVTGENKLAASKAAARELNVQWVKMAKDMEFFKLGSVKEC